MLTIAIPTMRRFTFLKETLPTFLAHEGVGEVIVCDETGEDVEEIQKIIKNPKLRLVVNPKRLGIYQNKRKVMGLATCPFIACLDSDNYFSQEWLDTVTELLKMTDRRTIYASAKFKNVNIETGLISEPCSQFSDLKLTTDNWNSFLKIPKWNFLLNDGNWVVPWKAVLCLPDIPSESLLAADAIFMLRCFVKEGFLVDYTGDLTYLHIVHNDSTWLKTEKESTRIFNTTDWRI